MNVLIDPGINEHFKILKKDLEELDINLRKLDMVINTHEHVDHFGANQHLPHKVPILAHRYAAVKIVSADDEVLLCRAHGENPAGHHAGRVGECDTQLHPGLSRASYLQQFAGGNPATQKDNRQSAAAGAGGCGAA